MVTARELAERYTECVTLQLGPPAGITGKVRHDRMPTHTVSTSTLRGTVESDLHVHNDELVCTVDLAHHTLGVATTYHPNTMLRGTVTYTRAADGRCVPMEHDIHAANGEHMYPVTLQAVVNTLQRYAARALGSRAARALVASLEEVPSSRELLATVLDLPVRSDADDKAGRVYA